MDVTNWMGFEVEKFDSIVKKDWVQFEELIEAHWKEIAKFKQIMKLNVHVPRYLQIEKEGRLHFVSMRQNAALVGYSVHVIVRGHPHYRHLITAEDDVHYITPSLRGTGSHEEMRKFALKTLHERGVHFVTARTKIGHAHGNSLRRVGYEPLDMVYGLDLAEWVKNSVSGAVGSDRPAGKGLVQSSEVASK